MHDHQQHDAKEILHEKGLKFTPLREALLHILQKQHRPLSAEEISQKIKNVDFDQASLFRGLKKLSEVGILTQVNLGEGFGRYEYACHKHHHHHHVMCSNCKKISIIPFCIPKKIEQYLAKSGYTQITHRMDFFGLCGNCS